MEASLVDVGVVQPLRHINLRPVRHPGGVSEAGRLSKAGTAKLLLLSREVHTCSTAYYAACWCGIPCLVSASDPPLLLSSCPQAPDPAAAGLGPPLLVRQLTRVTGLASLSGGGEGSVPLPMPITVRIYMSSSSGSAASADTAAADPAAAGGAAAQGGEVARLQARLAALERMSRRVAKAQQTIVKGVPTPMPSRSQAAAEGDATRLARPGSAAAAGAGAAPVTSPTAAQRAAALLASSHASGLHRLAHGSTSFSPFRHKRPHPADSEASSSSGSSGGWVGG